MRASWLAALCLAAACGGSGDPFEFTPPVVHQPWELPDPAQFDCTAAGVPERASPVPASCALDRSCRTPQVSGHRGVGGEQGILAPEDTLSAYRAAIAFGLELVETDPRPSADGVLVNLHDPEVDRTTSGTGAAADLTLAEIQALAIDAERFAGDFSCERVPTLVEVLETCRGRATVLVDANKTDRVDLLVAAIQEADALDWAVFDTSSLDKIQQALALEPGLHIQIRPGDIAELGSQLDQLAPRVPEIVELEGADPDQTALVHERGTRAFTDVFVLDVEAALTDSVEPYGRALDAGIDILQTDRPDLVLELLYRRGLR